MAVINPVGESFRIDTANTVSAGVTQSTNYLRVVAMGSSYAHVAIGSAPTAAVSNVAIVKDVPEIIAIGKPTSQVMAGVTTGTTTKFRCLQGEGSQFIVGQRVYLEDPSKPYWNETVGYSTVTFVGTDYGTSFLNSDYPHNVIVTIGADSSGILTETSTGARLVSAFQVSALKGATAGAGYVHCQQVQITGG